MTFLLFKTLSLSSHTSHCFSLSSLFVLLSFSLKACLCVCVMGWVLALFISRYLKSNWLYSCSASPACAHGTQHGRSGAGISGILSRRQTAASYTLYSTSPYGNIPPTTGHGGPPPSVHLSHSRKIWPSLTFPGLAFQPLFNFSVDDVYVGKSGSWFWYQHMVLFCLQMFDQEKERCLVT